LEESFVSNAPLAFGFIEAITPATDGDDPCDLVIGTACIKRDRSAQAVAQQNDIIGIDVVVTGKPVDGIAEISYLIRPRSPSLSPQPHMSRRRVI